MFDFFRDMALEASGIDSEAANKKKMEQRKSKQRDKYIFSKSMKRIIYFFGILYLVMGGMSMIAIKGHDGIALSVAKFVFLSAVDIAGITCLMTGKKKAEIAALVLVIIFVVVMYTTTMIL